MPSSFGVVSCSMRCDLLSQLSGLLLFRPFSPDLRPSFVGLLSVPFFFQVKIETADIANVKDFKGDFLLFTVLAPGSFHDGPATCQASSGATVGLPDAAKAIDDSVGQGLLQEAVEASDFKAKMG